jgi:hypothetical protein
MDAVAKLTAESDHRKEVASSLLLRKDSLETGKYSSDDNQASMESPSSVKSGGFKAASVELFERMAAMKEKWTHSVPDNVKDLMDDEVDCIAKLKKHFPALYVLRLVLHCSLHYFFHVAFHRLAYCESSTILSLEEGEALTKLETECIKGGALRSHWFNFLRAFSFLCFNEYKPNETGLFS